MNMYLGYYGFHKLYQVDGGAFQSEDLDLIFSTGKGPNVSWDMICAPFIHLSS